MNPAIWGPVLAGLFALAAAVYTANSARKSAAKAATTTAEATDRESQREFAMELLQTLSAEVEKLNARVAEIRGRLQVAEDATDEERKKRRAVEKELRELQETVERIKALIATLPGAMEHPEIRRLFEPGPA
jgi:peptidoglycan hydrolase CwlO-like protein